MVEKKIHNNKTNYYIQTYTRLVENDNNYNSYNHKSYVFDVRDFDACETHIKVLEGCKDCDLLYYYVSNTYIYIEFVGSSYSTSALKRNEFILKFLRLIEYLHIPYKGDSIAIAVYNINETSNADNLFSVKIFYGGFINDTAVIDCFSKDKDLDLIRKYFSFFTFSIEYEY